MKKEQIIDKTIGNIEKDRDKILGYLSVLEKHLVRDSKELSEAEESEDLEENTKVVVVKTSYDSISKLANSMAKLVDNLQRTNEQMLKVATEIEEEEEVVEEELSTDQVFEMIKKEKESEIMN